MYNDNKYLKPEWAPVPVSALLMRQSRQQIWGHRKCTFVLRMFSAYLTPTVWLASTESDVAWVPVSADLEQKEFNIVFEPMTQFWIMFLPLFFLVSRRIFWLTTIPWQRSRLQWYRRLWRSSRLRSSSGFEVGVVKLLVLPEIFHG